MFKLLLLESLRDLLESFDFFLVYRFASRPPFPVDVLVGFQLACCTAARPFKTVVRPNQLFFSRAFGALGPMHAQFTRVSRAITTTSWGLAVPFRHHTEQCAKIRTKTTLLGDTSGHTPHSSLSRHYACIMVVGDLRRLTGRSHPAKTGLGTPWQPLGRT